MSEEENAQRIIFDEEPEEEENNIIDNLKEQSELSQKLGKPKEDTLDQRKVFDSADYEIHKQKLSEQHKEQIK